MLTKFLSWLTLFGLLTMFNVSAFAQTAPGTSTPAATPATTPRLGEIRATRVVNDVTVENIATKVRTPLTEGQVITQGNIVRTGAGASVVLIFSNGATVSLAFDSELNIEQFLQDPFAGTYKPSEAENEPSVSVTSIRLTRGELVGNVKKLKADQGSKFTVGTPVGAAGIRGTTFRIVYRPTGNGQAFNFVLTTVEGNVELATGTVTMPVSVTDNKEVIINEVTVDPTTNAISITTSTGDVVTLAAPPPPTDAPVTTVQQVTNVATNLAQAIVDVVIAPPTQSAPPSTSSLNTGGGSGDGGSGGGGGNSENNSNTQGNTGGDNAGGNNTGGTNNNSSNNSSNNNPPSNNNSAPNSPGNTPRIPPTTG